MGRHKACSHRKNNGSSKVSIRALAHAVLVLVILGLVYWKVQLVEGQAGRWKTLTAPGVSAMHITVNRFNKVIVFDRTNFGPSQLPLPNGRCRKNPQELALKTDCTAHSYEYDVATNKYRPLFIFTDTWCSSGASISDGTLVHTGGFHDGAKALRTFTPCANRACNWVEKGPLLFNSRWYASDQLLPDNRVIVVGGRQAFTYEFVPRKAGETSFGLPFLLKTNLPNVENNLYPFLHLSSDGNLFIFANTQSILLNYKTNKVVKTFPPLIGGARNYPSSGSSVMLPLQHTDGFKRVEVLICGGAADGAFQATESKKFFTALRDCARIVITDPAPRWVRENMPQPRVMCDILILPTGDILIINGAQQGTAGWGRARVPSLAPFLYAYWKPAGRRFQVLASTTIPRMYHSSAAILHDGRVLVGGSNTQMRYVFSGVPFPTELRLEAFSPYYLNAAYNTRRPKITAISSILIRYGARFTIRFTVPTAPINVQYNIYYPPFTTHSYSMGQRMLFLAGSFTRLGTTYIATVTAPPSAVAAPSAYYMLRVINNGVPSTAAWLRFA